MTDRRLSNKVAFVTGATSGIGRACALAFARNGASVACVGRNEKALQDTARKIQDLGTEALMLRADLEVEREAENALNTAVRTFGGIDILVNAAGHISSGTIENTSLQAWDEMMNVNVRAIFNLM
jgi:NADP-dependent 3-hydroxy acid dehydrogenase YdfG